MKQAKNAIASLLPGIFLIGYNIGTGSLTAMSKAGANFGIDLLWAVLLSCVITGSLISFYSRFTMASGMTAMEAYRRHLHPVFAWVLWAGLATIILSALMAMIGLLSDVVVVWCREMWSFAADRRVVGVALALIACFSLFMGMQALQGLARDVRAIW